MVKDKSFKTSYAKMYMVSPDIYNRLLNLADTAEIKKMKNDNNLDTDINNSHESVTVPSPFDNLNTKIQELEQKLNFLSDQNLEDQFQSQNNNNNNNNNRKEGQLNLH